MSESWQEWLAAYRATEPMTCELVPLMDICTEAAEPNPERRWGIQLDGNFRRPDGGFFKFVGARIRAGTREIG